MPLRPESPLTRAVLNVASMTTDRVILILAIAGLIIALACDYLKATP